MTMQTADVTQLKHEALDKLIFHMTPKQWLTESGPWVLDRSRGLGGVPLDTDLGGDPDDVCALAMLLGWPPRSSLLPPG